MDRIKCSAFVRGFIILISLFFIYEDANAQMRVEYPKRFRIKGLIELIFTNYSSETKRSNTGWSTFEQNYTLGLEGYIYHPRLAVFSTEITLKDLRSVTGIDYKSDVIDYNISTTLLPYRPISLDLYAIKTYYTANTAYNNRLDITTNNYGVRLKINPRNRLPLMRIEYEHFDSTSVADNLFKVKSDRFDMDVRGNIGSLRTTYGWELGFSDISTPTQSYKTQFLNGYTDTKVIIAESLKNNFRYTDDESSKSLSLTSRLAFRPGRRFIQDYLYDYYNAEYKFSGDGVTTGIKNVLKKYSRQSATGTWGYKITERLYSSLSLNYGIRKEDDQSIPFYGINTGLSYSRPIAGIDVSPRYGFIFRQDKNRGKFNEHSLDINLSTRRFRWATIYADYSFTKSEETYRYVGIGEEYYFVKLPGEVKERKTGNTTHSIKVGARGKLSRGLSRSFWNLEAGYLNSTTHRERPIRVSEEDVNFDPFSSSESKTEKWTEKIRQYSLLGELQYPVLKFALFNLKTGYTIEDTETKGVASGMKKFFYDLRFNYPISQRLYLLAWWIEIWQKVEGIPNYKTRDYMLQVNYRRGRIFLSLEFEVLREETGDSMIQRRRIYLKLRRPIG